MNMVQGAEDRAQRDLPSLLDFSKRLGELSENVLGMVRHPQDDYLGYMGGAFLCKQLDHMSSVLEFQGKRDAELIARSMMEGAWQLAWAAQDSPGRPFRWQAFAAVERWRTMRRELAHGRHVPPATVEAVESQLRQFGDEFLLPPGNRRNRKIGEVLDPYHDSWRGGVSLREVAQAAGNAAGHGLLYSGFSEWHHWGAAGISGALSKEGGGLRYIGPRASERAVVVSTAFGALWSTNHVVAQHLCLPELADLQTIFAEYVERHDRQ